MSKVKIKDKIVIEATDPATAIVITQREKTVKLTATTLRLMLKRSDKAWGVNDKILHFLMGEE